MIAAYLWREAGRYWRGGVAFPLLLLLLPIALIGGAVDLIKKIVRLVKRDQR